ncbi:hypothetical protein LCGC14_1155430 [marine sediment metagenome]|uniref:Uncharacterized protein n=1 Tax=marine sediment metagenome TaxID=412755 RepID=A0A0F9PZR9_9ZZZZ
MKRWFVLTVVGLIMAAFALPAWAGTYKPIFEVDAPAVELPDCMELPVIDREQFTQIEIIRWEDGAIGVAFQADLPDGVSYTEFYRYGEAGPELGEIAVTSNGRQINLYKENGEFKPYLYLGGEFIEFPCDGEPKIKEMSL